MQEKNEKFFTFFVIISNYWSFRPTRTLPQRVRQKIDHFIDWQVLFENRAVFVDDEVLRDEGYHVGVGHFVAPAFEVGHVVRP